MPLIRPAKLEDLPAITAIYGHWVLHGTASFELDPPSQAEMTSRFKTITGGGYPYFVAESQSGKVQGYAYASAYRARPAYDWAVEDSIYIAPDTQRSGAGRELLATLVSQCTTKGFRQMIAVIGDSANAASIQLHRAQGFTFSGTLHSVGFKFGRWLDVVLMQRSLGEGDGTPAQPLRR